jgi:integrase
LAHALPALGSTKHFAALPFVEVHEFMEQLSAINGIAARALEFAILTAARTGDVTGARWSEIDLGLKVWTIPAARMKSRKEHRVPLSERALAILKALPREADFVFPGTRTDQRLGHHSLDQVLKRLRPSITVHGFRSTFRDWAADKTTYANHVVEMALAHSIGSAVEAAYRRGDLLAQRAHLMDDWERYCMTPPAITGGVVQLLRGQR